MYVRKHSIISIWLRVKQRGKGTKQCNYFGEIAENYQQSVLKQQCWKCTPGDYRFPLSNKGLWFLGQGNIVMLHTLTHACKQRWLQVSDTSPLPPASPHQHRVYSKPEMRRWMSSLTKHLLWATADHEEMHVYWQQYVCFLMLVF